MNFEMAAELAADEGIAVESVVIDDDVAVRDSLHTAGRRGVGATVLAEKICGAAAEQGRPLAEVAALCRAVNAGARSMGVALTSCTVPMVGKPTFELGDDEIELGVGIHGEPGRERRPLAPARTRWSRRWRRPSSTTCPSCAATACWPSSTAWARRRSWSSTSSTTSSTRLLEARGIAITRNLVGPYMTALDMAGCSITLLRLDDELTALWDAPVVTPGLRWGA